MTSLKRSAAHAVATAGPPLNKPVPNSSNICTDAETSTELEEVRTFTSQKLDWINAVASHPKCKDRHVRFVVVIAKIINARTRIAIVTDDTLRDLLPGFSRTKIYEVRCDLDDWGVIKCAVPGIGRPTHYGMRTEFIEGVNEWLRLKREQREERREERNEARLKRLSHVRKREHAKAA